MLEQLTQIFYEWTATEAFVYSSLLNLFIFGMAMLIGEAIIRFFPTQKVAEANAPVSGFEWGMVAVTLFINSLVNFFGWILWKNDYISISHRYDWRILADVVLLFLFMDLLMYVLHRIGHLPWLYPWVHQLHHRYEHPRPLSLFVLSPAETISFGAVWLVLLCVYPTTWIGISIYLGINLVFGVLGHTGVEPLPKEWASKFPLKYLTTSTFHAHHHQDGKVNYGFYTIFWDLIANTLAGYYHTHFGKISPELKKK
jgi:lathosterol oxidase